MLFYMVSFIFFLHIVYQLLKLPSSLVYFFTTVSSKQKLNFITASTLFVLCVFGYPGLAASGAFRNYLLNKQVKNFHSFQNQAVRVS